MVDPDAQAIEVLTEGDVGLTESATYRISETLISSSLGERAIDLGVILLNRHGAPLDG